jgi:general secretion pathway protein G
MKKSAFTMIELIFVILVLGILAVIAIPKLTATRDDAKISTVGKNIMTASFEIASYVVAKNSVDPVMSHMSDAIQVMVASGDAVESERHVAFKMGTIPNCVNLDINSSEGGNVELLDISYASPAGDHLCAGLQQTIHEQDFPIPLKGKKIVR